MYFFPELNSLVGQALGARDFSCAVSGFGQGFISVVIMTRAKSFASREFGLWAEKVFPPQEKTSGTQGKLTTSDK